MVEKIYYCGICGDEIGFHSDKCNDCDKVLNDSFEIFIKEAKRVRLKNMPKSQQDIFVKMFYQTFEIGFKVGVKHGKGQ